MTSPKRSPFVEKTSAIAAEIASRVTGIRIALVKKVKAMCGSNTTPTSESEKRRVREWVSKFPLASTVLLEIANVSQLIRMWSEQSALGQSLVGWISVWCALVLWYTYYRVMLPNEKIPRRCQFVGILMNSAVICTVLHFRHYAV